MTITRDVDILTLTFPEVLSMDSNFASPVVPTMYVNFWHAGCGLIQDMYSFPTTTRIYHYRTVMELDGGQKE